jgi:N-acetyltransferase
VVSTDLVALIGRFATLEPLEPRHTAALLEAGREESTWRWMLRGPLTDLADADAYIRAAQDQSRGRQWSYAILPADGSGVAGSTRLFDFRERDRGIEIGHTWLHPRCQRTGVNTDCKRMLLAFAFDTLECVRVQLKTDARNERSRRAIERIGGTLDGVLRSYQLTQGGRYRDTAMYSILRDEWPDVRARLDALLTRNP